MGLRLHIACWILLLCTGIAEAAPFGQYDNHYAEKQPYESTISTAEDLYNQRMASCMAVDPYAPTDEGLLQDPLRASRPGGGTGVIPNPTPTGDGWGAVVICALLYTMIKKWKRKKTGSAYMRL